MNTDIGTSINMSALAVSQLLENAQTSGVDLQLDTSAVENAMLLDAVERMSLDNMGRTPSKAIGKLVRAMVALPVPFPSILQLTLTLTLTLHPLHRTVFAEGRGKGLPRRE